MSDISTELSMNGFILFTEYNILLNILIMVIVIVLVCSIRTLYGDKKYSCGCEIECACNGCCNPDCGCNCKLSNSDTDIENFGNDKFYSYKDTIYPNYTSYQSAALSSLDESLNFGQGNRYIVASNDGSKPIGIIFDIYCNLYLLNGNPFGMDTLVSKTIKQAYLVYLKKDDNRKLLGELKANSDQVYKLKFTSDKPTDYINFNQIEIVYLDPNGKETPILSGKFTIA